MSETPPPVPIEPARRSWVERVSVVWVVPIIALLIALGVAYSSYADRGPLIEITFETAAGVKANQTELHYRDVVVGLVEEVRFTDDLGAVVAVVRVDKDVAPFIDSSARFWVVRPEVTTQGVSGLDTVLNGVYIEGSWDNVPDEERRSFVGLTDAPLIRPGRPGLELGLRAVGDTVLNGDTPIFFRGVEVGRMGTARISRDGGFTIAEAIIYEPYDRLISDATRFWDSSGFTFSLGPAGAELDFTSLASLVGGGVTFDTFISGGAPAQDGDVFDVFAERTTARASVFNVSDVEPLNINVIFEENVAGLAVGAPVELNGLRIGEVSNVNGLVDRARFGDARVRLIVTLSIQPARLGLQGEATAQNALDFLTGRVVSGLRARLASAGLLSGGLKVEFVMLEDAEFVMLDRSAEPFPVMPVTDSEISDVTVSAEGALERISALPVEELLNSAIDFLNAGTALVADQALQDTPEEIQALIGDMRGLVGSEAAQNVPVLMEAALQRIEAVARQLEEDRAVARVLAAVDAATEAASGVPDLVAELNRVAATAAELPLETLVTELTDLVDAAEDVIDTEDARALPGDLSAALAELQATLTELREGGAVANVNAAMSSARQAADQVALSAQDLPRLLQRMNTVLSQASTTLQSYDESSQLNRSAREALRDLSKAADAVSSLARAIERNPNSLLLGR
ncbi:MAG: MlaD family protein [Pseudomonadota bacterium]